MCVIFKSKRSYSYSGIWSIERSVKPMIHGSTFVAQQNLNESGTF